MPYLNSLERVGKVQNTIPEELERYGLFKKLKARVAKLNALNPEPVSGTTSMMDFSQVVYDRLSDETVENDGEALFEKISSYGRSFITNKVSLDGPTRANVQEVKLEWTWICADKTGMLTQNFMTVESKLPWCETLEQGLLLSRSTVLCSARLIRDCRRQCCVSFILCCTHVLTVT